MYDWERYKKVKDHGYESLVLRMNDNRLLLKLKEIWERVVDFY